MKLYTADNSELMYVKGIRADGGRLIISGTIMGAMPVEAVLTGAEMRKAFSLLGFRTMLSALWILLSGRRK